MSVFAFAVLMALIVAGATAGFVVRGVAAFWRGAKPR